MKTIVISLGGSVIIKDKLNKKFLLGFRDLISKIKNYRFVIICGAGGLKKMMKIETNLLNKREKDLIGIDATRLNALVVSSMFYDKKQLIPESIKEISLVSKNRRITVAGGTEPGHTTDYVSAVIAKKTKACCLINISNVKGVYTKDPNKYKNAELIEKLSLSELYKMFGCIKRSPGQKILFDEKATKFVVKNKIKTYFVGADVKNLERLIKGWKFTGTEIY